MTITIHSGLFRGMKLVSPEGQTARPTLSRVREAVLNAMGPRLGGAQVADLFAGTGAWGIEALSRGAKACVFVERDRKVLYALRQNLEELHRRAMAQNLPEPATKLHSSDLEACLAQVLEAGPYDIVWGDPPYAEAAAWAELLAPHALRLVTPGGMLALESGKEAAAAVAAVFARSKVLCVDRQRNYGDTVISMFVRGDSE